MIVNRADSRMINHELTETVNISDNGVLGNQVRNTVQIWLINSKKWREKSNKPTNRRGTVSVSQADIRGKVGKPFTEQKKYEPPLLVFWSCARQT